MKRSGPRIARRSDEVTEDEETDDREQMKKRWPRVEVLVGAEKRLQMIARELFEHFENRLAGMDGKGMIVHEPPHLRGPLEPDHQIAVEVAQ